MAGGSTWTHGLGRGLRGMADRLEAIGGTLDIRSAPGEGTRVRGEVIVGHLD